MADDLNLTPADARASAPVAEPGADEPSTTEIVALVVTGTDAEGGAVRPPTSPDGPARTVPAPAAPAVRHRPGTAPAAAARPRLRRHRRRRRRPPARRHRRRRRSVRPPARTAAGRHRRRAGGTPPPPYPSPTRSPTDAHHHQARAPARARPPAGPGAASAPPPDDTPDAPAAAPQPARPQSDWAAEVADRIDEVVAKVRANTSDRLVGVARMVVFGLLAAVMGITALVLVLILFFRLLAIIPGPVWIPYLGLGAIFVARRAVRAGRSGRRSRPRPEHPALPHAANEVEGEPPAVRDVRDVIIIGSGPAGLTSAIYTARANLRPLVIEGELSSTGDQPGGQLMLTTEVENFPGFIDGIQGPELMANFRAQAARFGAEFLTEKVTRVDFSVTPVPGRGGRRRSTRPGP